MTIIEAIRSYGVANWIKEHIIFLVGAGTFVLVFGLCSFILNLIIDYKRTKTLWSLDKLDNDLNRK